jgi:hypothetical protein
MQLKRELSLRKRLRLSVVQLGIPLFLLNWVWSDHSLSWTTIALNTLLNIVLAPLLVALAWHYFLSRLGPSRKSNTT